MLTVFSVAALACGCTVPSVELAESRNPTFKEITDGKTTKINPEIPGVQVYRTFYTGTTGFVPEDKIRSGALQEITSYCSESGKVPYLIEETMSVPPYILGNWQRIVVSFSCIEDKD
jgi:hypothetical protein